MVNGEPTAVGHTGSDSSSATVTPGLCKDSSRPGGYRTNNFVGGRISATVANCSGFAVYDHACTRRLKQSALGCTRSV